MVGTQVPFSAFYASTVNLKMPIVAYVIKLPKPFSPRRTSLRLVQVDNFKATRPERKEKKGVALLALNYR